MQQSKQLRIILCIATVVVTIITVVIILKSKEIMNALELGADEENTNIVVMTSDVINDQSWGGLAYKGKLRMEEQFPVNVEMVSELTTENLMQEALSDTLEENPNIVIGHGREFSEVFTEIAPSHQNVQFITIHGDATYENQSVYTFDQNEIEYFAAIIAAIKTKTNKIGLIDAYEAREKNPGFEKGIEHYNPDATFYYDVVKSRNNGKKAVQIMEEMINDGVDVIYSKGNAYNQDVINMAKEKSIYVIGYLEDQSYMGKDVVLTSIINDVPQAYIAILSDYFSETGIPSGKTILNENDGVYHMSPFGPMVTEEETDFIHSEIDRLREENNTF
ncbi:BMP family ABC transporter substrate-binding protein [Aquibacillus rhizosphaerae]|uniref:BMP family ABC transporter substrate-binding protein n=1 Tax=Aquibacillus rhizosphaerae TaxID=3051431 RepID=A0ABT7L4B7_9BACI|nr:BMP family ABC transporter substrate-binding protein [Aquibacillus sp. LR5S19]MDL4840704.1 BMP family ABC transporter substrate-binding protein [Aquibacillus sp. LR5S19]